MCVFKDTRILKAADLLILAHFRNSFLERQNFTLLSPFQKYYLNVIVGLSVMFEYDLDRNMLRGSPGYVRGFWNTSFVDFVDLYLGMFLVHPAMFLTSKSEIK